MTDTTPSEAEITRTADRLYSALSITVAITGDYSGLWPMVAERVINLLADDNVPHEVRIMRARALLAARDLVVARLTVETRRMTGEDNAINAAKAGQFDAWFTVTDGGQRFECCLCGDVVRAFEDDQRARAAARQHLIDRHAGDLRDWPDLAVDDEDDRCQPIGCDAGRHLPGCRYIERDVDATLTLDDTRDDPDTAGHFSRAYDRAAVAEAGERNAARTAGPSIIDRVGAVIDTLITGEHRPSVVDWPKGNTIDGSPTEPASMDWPTGTGANADGTDPDNPNMPPHAFHAGRADGRCKRCGLVHADDLNDPTMPSGEPFGAPDTDTHPDDADDLIADANHSHGWLDHRPRPHPADVDEPECRDCYPSCTCPPPANGTRENRGHLLGCPALTAQARAR